MKRYMALFFFCCMGMLLTGCSDMVEIEDRDFVLTMLVSQENENYKIYYGLPDLSEQTGQATGKADKSVLSFTGTTFSEIEEKYALQSDKRLDYSHLKVILIDEKAGKSEEKIRGFLEYLKENYEISRNTLAFYTLEDISTLAEKNGEIQDGIGGYLENLYKNTEGKGSAGEITVGNLVTAMSNGDETVIVPAIKLEKDKLCLAGGVIYNGHTISEAMSEKEYLSFQMLLGKAENNRVFPSVSSVVRLEETKTRMDFSMVEDKPYVTIQVSGIARIIEGRILTGEALNQYIMQMLNHTVNKFYKEQRIDCINLYRKSGVKNRAIWLAYQNRQKEFIENLSIGISSDIKIRE